MTTPQPAAGQPAPRRQRRWFRLAPARIVAAVAGLALLVVGGVAGALLFSGSVHGGTDRPGLARMDERGHGPGRGADRRAPGGPVGVPDRGPGVGPVVLGTVVSTGTGSLVVTPDGAAQRTLRTDDRTRVDGAGARTLADLTPGRRVAVSVTGTGDAATAVAVRVAEASVLGTVTAVAGDTATLISDAGLVVTVNTAAASPKPAVGDTVVVTGTAFGTTITATTVTVLPKAS